MGQETYWHLLAYLAVFLNFSGFCYFHNFGALLSPDRPPYPLNSLPGLCTILLREQGIEGDQQDTVVSFTLNFAHFAVFLWLFLEFLPLLGPIGSMVDPSIPILATNMKSLKQQQRVRMVFFYM